MYNITVNSSLIITLNNFKNMQKNFKWSLILVSATNIDNIIIMLLIVNIPINSISPTVNMNLVLFAPS